MNLMSNSSSLIIDRKSVAGSVSITGLVPDGDDTSVRAAIDAARVADEDVVIILTHRARRAEEVAAGSSETVEGGQRTESMGSVQAVAAAVARALSQRQSMQGLIEQLSPPTAVPSTPAVLQARRNAVARSALIEEHGALTAAEVADLAGSSAHNRSALAARWRKEGRVFAVPHQGVQLYPVFQFGLDARPLPAIAEVLRIFDKGGLGEWEIALWFTARNGWLADARPLDLLESDPDSVRDAARHEVDSIAG